jgi:hypothetical protein
MCTTLTGAVLALLKLNPTFLAGGAHWLRWCLLITLLCFLGAGACGGAIASNIPDCKPSEDFATKELQALWTKGLKYPKLACGEHSLFWFGILVAVASIAVSALMP